MAGGLLGTRFRTSPRTFGSCSAGDASSWISGGRSPGTRSMSRARQTLLAWTSSSGQSGSRFGSAPLGVALDAATDDRIDLGAREEDDCGDVDVQEQDDDRREASVDGCVRGDEADVKAEEDRGK